MNKRPNILLLFSDQHNASVLGDHPDVSTPRLDGLASEGCQFSRAYCQNAICVPSRCSMFSGLYPRRFGSFDFIHQPGYPNGLAPCFAPVLNECRPIQAHLRQHGYTTAAFGKRHLYQPCDTGWDLHASHFPDESPHDNYSQWVEKVGHANDAACDWAAELGQGLDGTLIDGKRDQFALLATRESRLPAGATMEAFTAMRTQQFLEERSRDRRPFFCWSSFYRPHQPYTPLRSFWDRHDRSRWGVGRKAGEPVCVPPSLRQNPNTLPPFLRSWFEGTNRVWRLDLAQANEQLYRDAISAYYALVEEIDTHVGDIVDSLDLLGLADNTIVIYTSDHGDFAGAHGMIEKCAAGHNVYEDTLRVPLIIRWPEGIPPATSNSTLTELVDLYPTLLDLCALPTPPQSLDGLSLAGTLTGGRPHQRDFTVSENWVQSTIITDHQKFGRWNAPRNPDLHFDFRQFGDMFFENDPLELRPHANTAPPALAAQLDHWQQSHPYNPPEIPPSAHSAFAANKLAWENQHFTACHVGQPSAIKNTPL